MSKGILGFVLVGALLVCPAMGQAADMGSGPTLHTISLTKDYTPSPWTTEMGWGNRAMGKLGFGLKNLLLGWTEIIVQTRDAASSGGNVLVGFGKGIGRGIADEIGGVVHLVTFPITILDAPLPGGGTHLL